LTGDVSDILATNRKQILSLYQGSDLSLGKSKRPRGTIGRLVGAADYWGGGGPGRGVDRRSLWGQFIH
jgi:hypothetical protein